MTAPPRTMAVLPLVGTLYFIVSGGPYGLEELAKNVGFGIGIAVLLATPVLWSIPTALMVGELAAAIPEDGGYYVWVRRALGPFWGYQEAWLSLAASIFDMAIYPTLFVLYLGRIWPAATSASWMVGVMVIAAAVAWNLVGAKAVGQGSAWMTGVLLAPFVVLVGLVCCGRVQPRAAVASTDSPDWAGGVLIAMWNYMGWDNGSTVAGEVIRPQRTYPVGVCVAVLLVALTYVIPFAAMRAAGVDPSDWDTGAWVTVAGAYGGAALALAVVVGGMISAFGMLNALCLSYSRLPAALADDGYLPALFARRLPHNGAPWAAVVACALAWTFTLGLSFERLVSLDILLYGGSLVLEFVALVVLRLREPGLFRPFRVPGGIVGAALIGVPPTALLGFALVKNADERCAGLNALVFAALVVAIGPVLYAATGWLRRGAVAR